MYISGINVERPPIKPGVKITTNLVMFYFMKDYSQPYTLALILQYLSALLPARPPASFRNLGISDTEFCRRSNLPENPVLQENMESHSWKSKRVSVDIICGIPVRTHTDYKVLSKQIITE